MRPWKVILLVLLVASGMFLSGCWDYREVDNMYIVGGIAIDQGMDGHKYHLTFELLDLSGGVQNGSIRGKLIESDGDTIADAVGAATKRAEKALYFSDCKVVIFSKDVAANGMTPVLDWLNRDPQPRFTVQLLISQDATAGDIFKNNNSGQQVVSFNISSITEESYTSWGRYFPVKLHDADSILLGQGKSLTMPCVQIDRETNSKQVELSGTAVFQGDKYIGMLNEKQSQFSLFAADKNQGGILLTGETPESTEISLRIQKCSTTVTPVIQGNQISMNLNIKMQAYFDEENTSQNLLNRYGVNVIESYAENTLNKNVADTIRAVQKDFDSDIFGFGRKVYDKNPKIWQKVRPEWNQYFRSLKCNVTSEVNLTNSGFAFPKGHE